METILRPEAAADSGEASGADADDSVHCVRPPGFLLSLTDAAQALSALCRGSVQAGGLMSIGQTAQFAAEVEALARSVDYLQIVCAGVLENHRVAETFGSTGPAGAPAAPFTEEDPPVAAHAEGAGAWNNTWAEAVSPAQQAAGKVRAEFRTTADYMRCRLRISRGEAQRRLKLASVLLPASGNSGHTVPAALPVLAGAAAAGQISSVSALIIAEAVDQVRQRSGTETADAMESDLASLGSRHDADFLARTARRWVLLADQDGTEPSDDELRRFQGVFPGRKKNGLNHLSIYCTAEQHETLLTVMNAVAGPRASDAAPEAATATGGRRPEQAGPGLAEHADGSAPDAGTSSRLDRRTRPQRLLSGLIAAAKAALATGGVPSSGGLRPQVMVTIDAPSLLKDFKYGSVVKGLDSMNIPVGKKTPRQTKDPETVSPGSFAFTGPVAAATVRELACDAEMLPVVLSGEGRILDVGRAQRLFPPHMRRALHARDGGCAFPGCSIPGPWTEAHHIRYWNRGGPTSTDNGVLLCSHHHHEVHKENWKIRVRAGVPWFVPPAYVDPDRVPLRNVYFRSSVADVPSRRSAS
ncbi:HNH endonuclease signature motif containing protein [Arthrobacter sp. ZGTC212]|uniref:HNH endonuclease signature motif containing protein n=1 Tax=Arthrobacter sp. ZGTC212 TaxID=2058899 RepID=UPI000CE41E4E|nr:HNH endonuclease signature motif containing protein [Arthrobacter sp. ZGTC212]